MNVSLTFSFTFVHRILEGLNCILLLNWFLILEINCDMLLISHNILNYILMMLNLLRFLIPEQACI